jgi:hypothetical protein
MKSGSLIASSRCRSNFPTNRAHFEPAFSEEIVNKAETVNERHSVAVSLTSKYYLCTLAGSDIGRVDVGVGHTTRTERLCSKRSESWVSTFDFVGRSIVSVCDVALDAVHRLRNYWIRVLQRISNANPSVVDGDIDWNRFHLVDFAVISSDQPLVDAEVG